MNKKVALVLSSGGCRGLAHIGVIEELLGDGYEISSISGASIGSLIGGIYASGNLEPFKKWISSLDEIDVYDLLDFTLTGQGFIKAEKILKAMEEFIGCKTFEELKIPLAVVATDIAHRQEIVFDKGNLIFAIRASIAIPTVITPVLYKDMILVDGGVINPIPANCVSRTKGDLLVVVDINANIPYNKPDFTATPKLPKEFSYKRKAFDYINARFNFFSGEKVAHEGMPGYLSVMDKLIDIMQDRICMLTVMQEPPDIKVEVSRDAATTFEFFKAEELIEAGRVAYRIAKMKLKTD